MRQGISAKVVGDYLADPNYKDLPSNTLAKVIYRDNPELFNSLETVRSKIRYVRGKSGEYKRKHCKVLQNPELPNGHFATQRGIANPFFLPQSDDEEWEPYELPKGTRRILIMSDIHLPYHNIEAVTKAMIYGKDRKPDLLLLNGDIMDFYGISRFEKDPRKRSFSSELEMGRKLLEVLRREFDGVPIVYKIGNHEARYESFLRLKAPELLGISEFQLDNLLRFGEYGVQLVTDDRIIKAGKLSILHGHEFGRSIFSPVNPARGAYMRSKENVIVGHHHQTSSHMEKSLNGDVVGAWSTGCLCEMHPAFARINKWNHGFAFVEIEPDGTFEVSNMSIINGKVR